MDEASKKALDAANNEATSLWQKWLVLYGWLGAHRSLAAYILGTIVGFTLGKVL